AALVTGTLLGAAPGSAPRAPRAGVRRLLRVARRDELVLGGVALLALIGLVGGGVNLLVPLELRANGVSASEIGLLFSLASAIYTVVSGIVARLGNRAATLRVAGLAVLGTSLSLLLVVASGTTVAAVAFVLLRAPFWSTMDTLIYPLVAAGAHRSDLSRGAVMGLVMLGWGVTSTVGPPLAGAIADVAGARAAFVVLTALSALVALWLLRVHRRPAEADEADLRPA
ncbi:MAG: MFS transporter, partial [Gaiellaceae bacterium]|nr:MFS transporter [Gaiellaceae bacterium]